jgi:type II secretory pathway component PulJ
MTQRPTPIRCARRGFALLELLALLVLVSAGLAISAVSFHMMLRASDHLARMQEDLVNFDRITEQMRADVWGAYEVRLGNERTVVIRRLADRMISWTLSADGRELVRRESVGNKLESSRRWTVPPGLAFASDGRGLTVTVDVNRHGRQATVHARPVRIELVSQVALLEAEP